MLFLFSSLVFFLISQIYPAICQRPSTVMVMLNVRKMGKNERSCIYDCSFAVMLLQHQSLNKADVILAAYSVFGIFMVVYLCNLHIYHKQKLTKLFHRWYSCIYSRKTIWLAFVISWDEIPVGAGVYSSYCCVMRKINSVCDNLKIHLGKVVVFCLFVFRHEFVSQAFWWRILIW